MSDNVESVSGEHRGSETKYTIPDDHWDEEEVEEENSAHPTEYIDSHTVSVYVDDEPNPTDNYNRTRYDAHVTYRDGEPSALYFTKYRWKGNYWRDRYDLDWRDTPRKVKRRVAAVVACDAVDDLDPEVRLIEEDGRNRWKEIHQPRMEASKEVDDADD